MKLHIQKNQINFFIFNEIIYVFSTISLLIYYFIILFLSTIIDKDIIDKPIINFALKLESGK